MRVPLGVQLSSAALDLALGRSMTLRHLEELDKEVSGWRAKSYVWVACDFALGFSIMLGPLEELDKEVSRWRASSQV
eukprot:scaffold243952_cov17-Tisochrysis_lutea.AAC.1